jgi:hypothetical protein
MSRPEKAIGTWKGPAGAGSPSSALPSATPTTGSSGAAQSKSTTQATPAP